MLKKLKDFFQYVFAYWDKPITYKEIKIEYTTKKPIEVQSYFSIGRDTLLQYRGAEHQLIHFTKNKLAIELIEKLKKDGLIEFEQYDDQIMNEIKLKAKLTILI